MISLFNDQAETMEALRDSMRRHKFTLLCCATGWGKTMAAAYMIAGAQGKNRRTVFTVPRRDLLEQTSATFNQMGIAHSYIAAGKLYNPYANVWIGMVPSMAARLDRLPEADLLIADETHYGKGGLDAVIQHYKSRGAWGIGLSGTPWKLSGEGLGCWYDNMVEGKSIRWLMDNKRLSEYRYYRGEVNADASKVKKTGGDFAKKDLGDFMADQNKIIGDVVAQYRRLCMGNRHLVRCVSVRESQKTAEGFRDAGIPFAHVDGETPSDERRRIFVALAKKELLGVTFCDLISMGFDLEMASGGLKVTIESGSETNPTMSLASQMQYWGRMLRYKEKPAVIIDHVNAYRTHDYPDTPREWTLADRDQSERASSERAMPVRSCSRCFYCHRPAPACPSCGLVYPIQHREIERVDGELVEITKEQREMEKQERERARKSARMEVGQCRTLEDLRRVAQERGYAKGWIFKQMQIKGIRA
jgi:superfamily II DNA or RNA helicase